MATDTEDTKYLYWLETDAFLSVKKLLKERGFQLSSAFLTPCQVLKASGRRVIFAPPEVWNRTCARQATWYHSSLRSGQYMMMSDVRLPEELDDFLDAELSESDFSPDQLPGREELEALVASEEYRSQKPEGWEAIGWTDALVFKLLFTATRFWRKGDHLKRHWLSHKANHANFLARKFTTKLDGEDVPYSVSENAGVCSSCAEFFNVVSPASRKLVRACPGSVIFGGAPRRTYLDVKPKAATVDPQRAGEAESLD